MQEAAEQETRIRELESEVAALNARVIELEMQLLGLHELVLRLDRSASDAADQATRSPADPTSPDREQRRDRRPASIFDNPASILEALKWDFRNDLARDPSFALGIDSTNELGRVEAAATLDSWLQRMALSYRKSVTWPARILQSGSDERSNVFTMQAVTPLGSVAGAPFTVVVDEAMVKRIEGWQEQGALDRVLMKGIFEPKLSAIELEETPPVVEETEDAPPPAIGAIGIEVSPYVRLDYSIKVSSIMPIFDRTTTPERAVEEMTRDGS